jgi:hypothetical protein
MRATGGGMGAACRLGGNQGGDPESVQYEGFDQLRFDQRRADFKDGFIREK